MSSDIDWLLIGVLFLVMLAFVIRVRMQQRHGFEPKPKPMWKHWMHRLMGWIVSKLPSFGWIMIGFMLGSLVVLWLEKFGIWLPSLPPITIPSSRE